MPYLRFSSCLIAIGLATLTGCVPSAPARFAPQVSGVDQPVEDTVVGKATGLVLVARHGRVIYSRAVGSARYPQIATPTRNTAFDLASISKTFTAVAVLRLVDQGRLDLNAPMKRYLPELPDDDITLHHALSHDTGWPQYLTGDDRTFKTSAGVMREIASIKKDEARDVLAAGG